jgi:hypothetical protein
MGRCDDLTIDEALSDPMIHAVMRADRVDPEALRASWGPLAKMMRERSSLHGAPSVASTWFETCTGAARGRSGCRLVAGA